MKLTEIATEMKKRAMGAPGQPAMERLPRGARPEKQVIVRLKYIATPGNAPEFHLQIQRTGFPPKRGTIQFDKWTRELATFARDFGGTSDREWKQQIGETTYAAVLTWTLAPAPVMSEPPIDPAHTEIIGVFPKPIRISSVSGSKP